MLLIVFQRGYDAVFLNDFKAGFIADLDGSDICNYLQLIECNHLFSSLLVIIFDDFFPLISGVVILFHPMSVDEEPIANTSPSLG